MRLKYSNFLTLDDTEQRSRSINARRTIDTLLNLNIVPIVNENDTIVTIDPLWR